MQRAQIIDITKTYIPCDPQSFVQNLINTNQEDGEEKALPIVPFDGYNFLATHYGYRGFFGINSRINVDTLPDNAQFVLAFQTPDFKTFFIALCQGGIWTVDATSSGATWTQVVTDTYSASYEEYSYCIIENALYCYKQGKSVVHKFIGSVGALGYYTISPTTINMAAQIAIFKAGNRLGFFDAQNAVAWSSSVDFSDFAPAVETGANIRSFGDVVGRIIAIKSHGNGFIIYASKSVVGVIYSETATLIFEGRKILDSAGLSHSRAVCYGVSENEHFAWTNAGIINIGSYDALAGSHKVQFILPELYDLYKEDRNPVYLDCLNSRYLVFQFFNTNYLYQDSSFELFTIDGRKTSIKLADGYWDGTYEGLPSLVDGNTLVNMLKQLAEGNVAWNGYRTRHDASWWPYWEGTYSRLTDYSLAHPTLYPTNFALLGNEFLFATWEQEKEWNDYEVQQAGVLTNFITSHNSAPGNWSNYGNPYSGGTPSYPADIHSHAYTEILSGKGPAALISAPGHFIYRKWFNHKYKVDIDTATEYSAVQIQAPTGSDYTYTYTVSSSEIAASDSCYIIILTYVAPDPFAHIEGSIFDYVYPIAYALNVLIQSSILFPSLAAIDSLMHSYGWTGAYASGYSKTNAPVSLTATDLTNGGTYNISNVTLLAHFDYTGPNFSMNFHFISGVINHALESPVGVGSISYNNELRTVITLGIVPAYATDSIYQNRVRTNVKYPVLVDGGTIGDFGYSQLTADQTKWKLLEHNSDRLIQEVTTSFAALNPYIFLDQYIRWAGFTADQWSGLRSIVLVNGSFWIDSGNPFKLSAGFIGSSNTSLNYSIADGASANTVVDGYNSEGAYHPPVVLDVQYPATNVLIQTGTPLLGYNVIKGGQVYDLQLKKWGKFVRDYAALVDLLPINADVTQMLSHSDLGLNAGILYNDFQNPSNNTIQLFDQNPSTGFIRYGRLGFYRLGFTDLHELIFHFRKAFTGAILIEGSLDGRVVDGQIKYLEDFEGVLIAVCYVNLSARWYDISITGNYDLTGVEVRATISGRR